jgi:hypothetical protein
MNTHGDILLKSGTYQKATKNERSRVGGQSLWEKVNEYLALEDPCCEKNIVATSVTTEDLTVTGEFTAEDFVAEDLTVETLTATTSVSTDLISEETAAAGVTIDGALIKDGGISRNDMFVGFFPTAAAQALSGAGAVNVTAFLTKYTSTGGAQALTIASGSTIGQRKKVSHVVDGGSGVLTGVFVGGTTITFTTVGEFADLIWTGTAWGVLELGNTATPNTVPALA